YSTVWTAAALTHLAADAASNVITSQQFGWALGFLISLCVTPAFFFRGSGLVHVQRRNFFEHEPVALSIAKYPSLAANPFSYQNAAHARRPDHPRGMELHKFHVRECSPGIVRERMTIAGIFPTVAGDLVRPSNSSSCENHRL